MHPKLKSVAKKLTKRETTKGYKRIKRSGYESKPYDDIDGFVSDTTVLVKEFRTEMAKNTWNTTVLGNLIWSTSNMQLEYLANHARFVKRNPDMYVINGT